MRSRRAFNVAALGMGITLSVTLSVWGAQLVHRFNGVPYRFPASVGVTGTVLLNDGTGRLSWVGVGVPTGITAWSKTSSCPAGWAEVTGARGRSPVGLVTGGTAGGTVGTALSNTENRAAGNHNHTVSDPTHTHAQTAHGHTVSDPGHAHSLAAAFPVDIYTAGSDPVTLASGSSSTSAAVTGISIGSSTATNNAATTGISIANAGTVVGTNAPYMQMPLCEKS